MDLNRKQRRQLGQNNKPSTEGELSWDDVKRINADEIEIISTDDHPHLVPNTILEVTGKARKITPRKSKTIKVIGKSGKKEGYYTVRIDSGRGVYVDVPSDTLTQLYKIKEG